MHWIYADEAQQQHEFAEEQFPALIAEGRIRQNTLVWNETLSDWQPCREVRPDLFDDGTPRPPVLTPAQRRQIQRASPETGGPPPLDTIALLALIFGVLGILCIQLFSLPAVICGHIGLKRANETPGNSTNKGFAIAGLITGYLGLAILLFILIFYGAAILIGISEGIDSAE